MSLHLWKRYWVLAPALGLFFIGKYIDDSETIRMSDFADKSKLYGKERQPGDYSPWDYYLKK